MVTSDDWRAVVELATMAPSIHNTQPWRFVAGAPGLDVYEDPDRALPVVDPLGRQRVMSCGAAVEFAVVAAAGRGVGCAVATLPDPAEPAHLARLAPDGSPADPAVAALASAIPRRHTYRAPFADRPVDDRVFDAARGTCEGFGAWLRVVEAHDDQLATAALLSQADELERADPAYRDELATWLRAAGAAEGIVPGTLPGTRPGERATMYRLRDFATDPAEALPPDATDDAPPPRVERQAVLVVGTAGDDRAAWLGAGRAVGRLLLDITAQGLVASPLTQVLDLPRTRLLLGQALHLTGRPQMLLRVGYPTEQPGGASPRRPVDEVFTARP